MPEVLLIDFSVHISWVACCNGRGEVFVVSVGDAVSGFGVLLSDYEGDPLLIYHDEAVYVLRMIGAIIGASPRWDSLDHCQTVRSSREFLVKAGDEITTLSKDDLDDDPTSLIDISSIHQLFIERRTEARFVNLRVKAQRIKKIMMTRPHGFETLR